MSQLHSSGVTRGGANGQLSISFENLPIVIFASEFLPIEVLIFRIAYLFLSQIVTLFFFFRLNHTFTLCLFFLWIFNRKITEQENYQRITGDQRRHRSDHLWSTTSSRNRSKHRSYSNNSHGSGSGTRPRSSSLTKRSPSPAGYISFMFLRLFIFYFILLDSRGRFNPTAYIREKNLKLRQIEIQK